MRELVYRANQLCQAPMALPTLPRQRWPEDKRRGPLCVFVIHHEPKSGCILADLQCEVARQTQDLEVDPRRSTSSDPSIVLTTDPTKQSSADNILLLLTEGVFDNASTRESLIQIISDRDDRDDARDRIVAMYSEAHGWRFGCEEQKKAEAESAYIKACMAEHEAIAYRNPAEGWKDDGCANSHEFRAVVAQLMRKLLQ